MFEHADLVYAYTREQAIADGVLVDLRQNGLEKVVRDAGFKVPIAMTAEAFHMYVEPTTHAKAAGCDINGRLWDVLIMLRHAIHRNKNTDVLCFDFLCVTDKPKAQKCTLKAVMGPDDTGGPCLTIMLPNQD